jgi:serine/threonine-protein kinase
VGVTIALVAVLALVAMRQSATATTRAPSLLGLQREAAVAEAGERGFRTSVTEADQGGVAGTVVGQDPAPDALLRRGSTITLLVTKGAPQVVVPDLADRQVIDAVRTLEEARLTPGEVLFQIDREQTPGTVKRSDPPAGTSVDEGTTVDIVAYAVPTEDSEAGDDGENGPDDRRGRRGNRGDD